MSLDGCDRNRRSARLTCRFVLALAPALLAFPPTRSSLAIEERRQGGDAAAAHRARRLEKDAVALDAQRRRVEAFGHTDEFGAALEQALGAIGSEHWCKVTDGWLPRATLYSWLAWNRPKEGRTAPAALDFELDDHPRDTIVDVARQLHEHGLEFVFVTFPARAQCYPELIVPGLDTKPDAASQRPPFSGMEGVMPRFLGELVRAGVEVVDLAPAFVERRFCSEKGRELLFLRSNSHWTPRGAELGAKVVADRLAEMAWFERGPIREGSDFEVKRRFASCRDERSGEASDASPEPIALDAVLPLNGPPDPERARSSPIVLLGNSFCWFLDDEHASFADQLTRFTGWPIDVVAPAGAGELTCRDALRRRDNWWRCKKVVVWRMPETSLVPERLFKKLDLFQQ